MGHLTISQLQMYCWACRRNIYEDTSISDAVVAETSGLMFYRATLCAE